MANETKVKIDLSNGQVEIQGDQKFVEDTLTKIQPLITAFRNAAAHNALAPSLSAPGVSPALKEVPVKKKISKNVQPEPFDFEGNGDIPSLKDFVTLKDPGNSSNKFFLVVSYYLQHFLHFPSVTEGNVEFAYKIISSKKKPINMRQVFTDAKNKQSWFEQESSGAWVVSRVGQVFVEYEMK